MAAINLFLTELGSLKVVYLRPHLHPRPSQMLQFLVKVFLDAYISKTVQGTMVMLKFLVKDFF